jgi:acetyltransferase-like isoleucine patch superfamily enzyme
LGKKVKIDRDVYFQNPEYISIDNFSWIDKGVMVLAGPDHSNRKKRIIKNMDFPLKKGHVHIGKNVHIGPYSIISGIGGVYISDDCGFSSGVKIYSFSNHFRSDHNPSDRNFHFGPLVKQEKQFLIEGPVYLGFNVGIALNAILLPGISIHDHSFVAINSVVSRSFQENSLIAGNPAQFSKFRFKD